ncbi:MAG: hypothetical protein NT022_09720 [Deltaproteobacteria bacterium]|nr:hypothetical protein [Deltaproteobacteria bacterium]
MTEKSILLLKKISPYRDCVVIPEIIITLVIPAQAGIQASSP